MNINEELDLLYDGKDKVPTAHFGKMKLRNEAAVNQNQLTQKPTGQLEGWSFVTPTAKGPVTPPVYLLGKHAGLYKPKHNPNGK